MRHFPMWKTIPIVVCDMFRLSSLSWVLGYVAAKLCYWPTGEAVVFCEMSKLWLAAGCLANVGLATVWLETVWLTAG